jgi:hypothetical protein
MVMFPVRADTKTVLILPCPACTSGSFQEPVIDVEGPQAVIHMDAAAKMDKVALFVENCFMY